MRLKPLGVGEVTDVKSFAEYCRQRLGVPVAVKEFKLVGMRFGKIRAEYPAFTWQAAARIADWAKDVSFRPGTAAAVLACYRHAWADGYLPALDPPDLGAELDIFIGEALQIEDNPSWRHRLGTADTIESRRDVFEEWKKYRTSSPK